MSRYDINISELNVIIEDIMKYLRDTGFCSIGIGPITAVEDSVYIEDAVIFYRWLVEFIKDNQIHDVEDAVQADREWRKYVNI